MAKRENILASEFNKGLHSILASFYRSAPLGNSGPSVLGRLASPNREAHKSRDIFSNRIRIGVNEDENRSYIVGHAEELIFKFQLLIILHYPERRLRRHVEVGTRTFVQISLLQLARVNYKPALRLTGTNTGTSDLGQFSFK